MYDLIIKNGKIIDGTGKALYSSDIGILNNTISRIARVLNEPAKETIDARDHIVCPGFIDIDSHSDFSLFSNPKAESKVRQGVTTEVVGQGGRTLGPISRKHLPDLKQYTASYIQGSESANYWDWATQYQFVEQLGDKGIAVNIASLVGYGSIRIAVMGFSEEYPSETQRKQMAKLLEDELGNGIHGISYGLDNSPDCLATQDEMIFLAKIVKSWGGICSIHMREEGCYLIESLEEVLSVCKESGVKMQISHLKAAHPRNWGKVKDAISLINKARQAGMDVDYDVYPYVSYESVLCDVLPTWIRTHSPSKIVATLQDPAGRQRVIDDMLDPNSTWGNPILGSSWDQITITSMKQMDNKRFIGMSITEISRLLTMPPHEAVIQLLIQEKGVIKIIFSAMIETDLVEVMKQSMAIFCTDGIAVSPYGDYQDVRVHPRYYGTYPRILGRYVREKKCLSLEDAIQKMTLLPAIKMDFKDRGIIAEGYKADITIFNPATIIDTATLIEPHQYPVGIKAVIVNGSIVVFDNKHSGDFPGKVIRRVNSGDHTK
jgi:N-acyl-D-amino-acid deacylase